MFLWHISCNKYSTGGSPHPLKQNENYSIYWADIYTDGQVITQNILKFIAILVTICSLSKNLKVHFPGFVTNFFSSSMVVQVCYVTDKAQRPASRLGHGPYAPSCPTGVAQPEVGSG